MLTEYTVKRGFGREKTKEYFVAQRDGDTLGGIVAGPFESPEQCNTAIQALSPLYNRILIWIGGHQTGSPLATDWTSTRWTRRAAGPEL
jgi:hypothetical protein